MYKHNTYMRQIGCGSIFLPWKSRLYKYKHYWPLIVCLYVLNVCSKFLSLSQEKPTLPGRPYQLCIVVLCFVVVPVNISTNVNPEDFEYVNLLHLSLSYVTCGIWLPIHFMNQQQCSFLLFLKGKLLVWHLANRSAFSLLVPAFSPQ